MITHLCLCHLIVVPLSGSYSAFLPIPARFGGLCLLYNKTTRFLIIRFNASLNNHILGCTRRTSSDPAD